MVSYEKENFSFVFLGDVIMERVENLKKKMFNIKVKR